MRIYCVGQLTIDDIVLPDGTVRMETLGGNAMYSAAGALLWAKKGEVVPITCAGTDFPRRYLEMLAEKGLDCSRIRRYDHPHMRSWMLYEQNRERRFLCRNEEVLPYPPISEESFHLYFEAYHRLHLMGSPLVSDFGFLPDAAAFHLAPQSYERHIANLDALRASHPGAVISLDPSPFYMRRDNSGQLGEVLSRVDIVLPSREELNSCFGEIDPRRAAETLCAMGPSVAVIKLGADGVYVYEKNSRTGVRIPSVSRDIVDTTGAGDSFCGGFLTGYVKTGDPLYAACCGTVSASYAVADYGPGKLLDAGQEEAAARQKELFQRVSGR